jgi:hypothetical protein
MAARIVEVRNAVVSRVNNAWVVRGGPDDLVLAPYRFDIDSGKHKGRKVYVFPSAYTGNPATRSEDQNDYSIVVLIVERYTGAGDPTDVWVDERVEWVEWLLNLLGDVRAERLLSESASGGLWPETAETTTVYDVEELSEHKLFVSVIHVTYREHTEG